MENFTLSAEQLGKVEKKQRRSGLELFRIISMLLIVAHHYVVNSEVMVLALADGFTLKSTFAFVFGAFGKIGINCFVLITGYFMCTSHITLKKFLKLFLEVMFYKILFFLVFVISGYEEFTLISAIKALIPMRSIATNFVGCFLVFYLCIPFLNILVKNMNEKMHLKLLLLLGFTYVLFGTFPKIAVTMNYVSWFAVLYFISSYVRLYPKKIFSSTRFWGFASLACLLLSMLSVVVCLYFGKSPFFFVTDSNALLAVMTGFSSFMYFNNLDIKYNRFINTVAASTFGVLLIHANSDTMRRWLWGDLLDNAAAYSNWWFPVHAVLSVVAVFCICTALDYLRAKFIEAPFFRFFDKKEKSLTEKYNAAEKKLCDKLNIRE